MTFCVVVDHYHEGSVGRLRSACRKNGILDCITSQQHRGGWRLVFGVFECVHVAEKSACLDEVRMLSEKCHCILHGSLNCRQTLSYQSSRCSHRKFPTLCLEVSCHTGSVNAIYAGLVPSSFFASKWRRSTKVSYLGLSLT